MIFQNAVDKGMGIGSSLKEALHGLLPDGMEWGFIPLEQLDRGDFASPIAFSLAKLWKKSAITIAQDLCAQLETIQGIESAHAVAGYVNITLKQNLWAAELKHILVQGSRYGHQYWGNGTTVNVEYVSANPTGPLHAAHARGAVFGDVVANLLAAVGYQVSREYYINDAGQQVIRLAETVLCHCKALENNESAVIPQGLYPGAYGQEIAQSFLQAYPASWRDKKLEDIATFAVRQMMADIQNVLDDLGVHHDVFTSEKALQSRGVLDTITQLARDKDLVYTGILPQPIGREDSDWAPTPLMLFRTSALGDDQDRVLQRSDGAWTYFANDIAYHWDKVQRKSDLMIDVWGADHASHVHRMTGAVAAVTGERLEVLLFQMVHFLNDGVAFKMSKRAGNFVLLRDVLEMVGKDVLRFMILTKKADTHLELDVVKMQEQSTANPVFYVQYAHARCCSVLRAAKAVLGGVQCAPEALAQVDPACWLEEPLLKILTDWPRQISESARHREPHRITNYLHKVAQAVHGLWQKGNKNPAMKLVQSDDLPQTHAAMTVVQAAAHVLSSGLHILGIEPKEELR